MNGGEVSEKHVTLLAWIPMLSLTLGLAHAEMQFFADTPWGSPTDEVIYGQDNRKDLYADGVSDQERSAAASTAVLMCPERLVEDSQGNFQLKAETLRERLGLCEDEPFAEQPAAGECSAFLVGVDLIGTAGHCTTGLSGCPDLPVTEVRVVFGYAMEGPNAVRRQYPAADVYRVAAVEASYQGVSDWALLRLDRPVSDRFPLMLGSQQPGSGDKLTVLGYPMGLPVKVASGGRVLASQGMGFSTDLDTYGGNSGSPVLSWDSLQWGEPEVLGILVSGARDFRRTDAGCRVSNRCQQAGEMGCEGESVMGSGPLHKRLIQDEEPSYDAEPEFDLCAALGICN